MPKPICFFLGNSHSFNILSLVENIGWMLGGDRELHLVTSAKDRLSSVAAPDFELIGDKSGRLRRGVGALERYLSHRSPAAVVQLTDPPVHGSIVGLLGRRYDVPTVYRYAGDRFREYRVARGRARLKAFAIGSVVGRVPLKLADHFVALGPTCRRRLCNRGLSRRSVTVLPPSIDRDRFAAGKPIRLDIPDDRKIVLSIGRISRLKGVETLERIVPRVLDADDRFHFLLVGAVERRPRLPEDAADHVTFTGPVSPEEIPGYMAAVTGVLHPSLSEGVPRVLLEALASETPVVARDVGDVSSITDNTFTTERECVELVRSIEDLHLDSVEPFTREALAPQYREFFGQFQ